MKILMQQNWNGIEEGFKCPFKIQGMICGSQTILVLK